MKCLKCGHFESPEKKSKKILKTIQKLKKENYGYLDNSQRERLKEATAISSQMLNRYIKVHDNQEEKIIKNDFSFLENNSINFLYQQANNSKEDIEKEVYKKLKKKYNYLNFNDFMNFLNSKK